MKWILRLVLLVALAVGGLAGFGALLPPGHVASSRIDLAQPAEVVFATLTDFAAHGEWRAGATIERLPDMDGQSLWREANEFGTFDFVLEEVEAPRRFVTRIVSEDLPFGGRWIYEVAPSASGCTVTITEDGEIHNVLFRALARVAFGYHGAQLDYLSALARHLGADPAPRPIEPTLAAPTAGG